MYYDDIAMQRRASRRQLCDEGARADSLGESRQLEGQADINNVLIALVRRHRKTQLTAHL
jgi:hypothetical protein